MAKRNVSDIETGAGFFLGFANALMDTVRENGVPFAAAYRLVTAEGRTTLGKVVDLIHQDWQDAQPKLAQVEGGHPYRGIPATGTPPFRMKVVYAIPAMDELKRRFPAYVNPAFNGITFKPIKVCEGVSRETREIEPEYVHLDRNASNDEVLAEIDKRGLRPCLPEELIAFGDAYPEEQRKFPIVALGSEAGVDGDRRVAYLWRDGDGRILHLRWVDDDWRGHYRFLAARK